MENSVPNKTHSHELRISCREKGSMTGIEKVASSSESVLNLVSSCGNIAVTGEKLHIIKYDSEVGTLEFEGNVTAIKYDGVKKPLLKRIFK